ncbi:MAG: hypothetical protein PHP42_06035 [Bacteroidota bacterium]|nr:hypothetical protein [Bacteroidota bacterium]
MNKIALALSYFLLTALFYSCVKIPSQPVLPSWDTQLSVPLMNKTFYLKDMIAKDSARFVTVNNELVYRPAELVNQPQEIVVPTLNPLSASFVERLGLIPISSVSVPGFALSFKDITGQTPVNGVPWPGGDQTLNKDTVVVSDSSTYDYLIYEEGQMTLTITNTFHFKVNFTTPINLVNASNLSEVVGSFTIGTVDSSGGQKTASVVLNGKRMESLLRMQFQVQTVGLNGTKNYGGAITATISITKNGTGNPTLSEAKMKLVNEFYLPVTSITDSLQKLDDSVFIKIAEFSAGKFDININNAIPFDVIVGFNLREFVNKASGQSFKLFDYTVNSPRDSIKITGGQNYNMNVLMKDYRLQSPTLTNGVHFSLNIKTLVRSLTKKVIRKTDSVLVRIIPDQIAGVVQPYVLDNLTGKIPPTIVPVNENVEANLGSSTNNFSAASVKFDSAQITLKIFTKSLFPTDLKFDITSVTGGVAGQKLSTPNPPVGDRNHSPDGVSYRIFPGDTAKIVFDKLHPDANGKTIDQFLSGFIKNGRFSFPDKFVVAGLANLEPMDAYQNDSVGYVKNHDSVYTSVDFSFPLRLGIMDGSYKDTASISSNVSDTAMTNSILGGDILFDVFNTFPLGIEIKTKLLRSNPLDSTKADNISPPVLVLDTIRVAGDNTTNHTGVKSSSAITLTGSQALKISQAGFTAMDIKLVTAQDNGATPVKFNSTDSIRVKSSANLRFNVDVDRLSHKK